MSEPEKPKRRFWQIHLVTALVLMLAACAINGLNIRARVAEDEGWVSYGWPIDLCLCEIASSPEDPGYFYRDQLFRPSFMPWRSARNPFLFVVLPAAIVSWLSMLIVTGILSEWLIRRRAATKGNESDEHTQSVRSK